MAAPAALPEFQGNVAAVHTARYGDDKLWELEDRKWRWMKPQYDPEGKYRELAKKLLPLQKAMNETKNIQDRDQRNKRRSELQEQMTNIQFSKDEIEYIKNNRSNRGYHYLGSGKMYSRFGEAFAKALIALDR